MYQVKKLNLSLLMSINSQTIHKMHAICSIQWKKTTTANRKNQNSQWKNQGSASGKTYSSHTPSHTPVLGILKVNMKLKRAGELHVLLACMLSRQYFTERFIMESEADHVISHFELYFIPLHIVLRMFIQCKTAVYVVHGCFELADLDTTLFNLPLF